MGEITGITDGRLEKVEVMQHDMKIVNRYRIEAIKLLIWISSAILVFSVIFQRDLLSVPISESTGKPLIIASWIFLFASIFSGIINHRLWTAFYSSWSKDAKSGSGFRKRITAKRRWSERVQILGFFVGLGLLVVFACINVYPKTTAEQGGSDQPATALESKPEGKEKPKSKSRVIPQ